MYIMYLLSVIEPRKQHQKLQRNYPIIGGAVDSDSDEDDWVTPTKRRRTTLEQEVATEIKHRNWDRAVTGMPTVSFE